MSLSGWGSGGELKNKKKAKKKKHGNTVVSVKVWDHTLISIIKLTLASVMFLVLSGCFQYVFYLTKPRLTEM